MPEMEETLCNYISKHFLEGSAEPFDSDTELIESGILDSNAMLSLVSFVEKQYGIDFSTSEIVVQNLETVKALVKFIQTKLTDTTSLPSADDLSSGQPATPAQDVFNVFDPIELKAYSTEDEMAHTNLRVKDQAARKLKINGKDFIDFASCNYLGLDYHPYVMDSISKLVRKWGTHPSWARFVASPDPYFELEEKLAEFIKAPTTVVFPCIALMNTGVLPILAGPRGVILCDTVAHHTIQEACQLSIMKGIMCVHFQEDDIDHLEKQLKRFQHKSPLLIAVDGVYSMSARYIDLPAYSALAKKYNAQLYVDDAHGLGVIGENPTEDIPYGHKGNGIVNYYGMSYEEDHIIYVSGLSKSFSSFASFITCHDDETESRLRLASTYVLSGPIPVASMATAMAGLEVNEKEGDSIRKTVYSLANQLVEGAISIGFEVDNTGSFPIVFVVVGGYKQTVIASDICWKYGLLNSTAVFPFVQMNRNGLRFSITALNTSGEIDYALNVLSEIFKKVNK
ncbi:MAG: aminotransferase class I/II-fold pyridoxal phosphate-dependent enzyme [Desulfobacteraceae bacterium]|nr:aminotransferase class I/II-fold pyridoxal phosphate-dependent enzyme [Desulfobacteraceae bacterium]